MNKRILLLSLTLFVTCLNSLVTLGNDLDESNVESVSAFFFRRKLLKVNFSEVTLNPKFDTILQEQKDDLNWLSDQLSMLPATSQNPNNIGIRYGDRNFAKLQGLVDLAFEETPIDQIQARHYSTLRNYLLERIPEIETAMHTTHSVKQVFFEDVQKSHYLQFMSLKHELIRVYGVDEALQQKIATTCADVVESEGLRLSRIFYFGSRVMPRSVVIKKDPDVKNLPISDDGVEKSSVRISGLTRISDLEVLVTVGSNGESTETASQLLNKLRSALNKDFYIFPISIKIFTVPEHRSAHEEFDLFNLHMTSRKKNISPYQVVVAAGEF